MDGECERERDAGGCGVTGSGVSGSSVGVCALALGALGDGVEIETGESSSR